MEVLEQHAADDRAAEGGEPAVKHDAQIAIASLRDDALGKMLRISDIVDGIKCAEDAQTARAATR